ncbi:hypothetical protein EDD90_3262 [Streptomyces sp. Ag109_O5-1]|uniref:transcription factor WhiB n=1 Tax=Streptomyces sp. Ag109_O5-1 TaxID=1938851 RepID=UPI000FC19CA8|nr:transcription factor WhiB [Streptomyces sp. Ag109_O5-1]RPE40226.1 hypothetical protein EDD90_3262 [Streptomyces sp. Ag109_O5-1]
MNGPWMSGVQVRRMEHGQTPIADQLCTACGMHKRVTGRAKVEDFMRANPLAEHRAVCQPKTT